VLIAGVERLLPTHRGHWLPLPFTLPLPYRGAYLTVVPLFLILLLAALSPSDQELIRAIISPDRWAATLTTFDNRPVASKDVRRVSCVGLEATYVLCTWDQRVGRTWRNYSQYADISQENAPRLLPGDRAVERVRRAQQ